MAMAQMDTVIRHLRRAVLRQDAAGRTDGQLLASFIDQKDEAAFDVLVRRHGPMVFGVCRRIVRDHHDAEDAFQATFLVLARKASSVRPRERLANWLHGVALRTAMKAKAMTAKRRGREKQVVEMPEPEAAQHEQWRDLQPLLDQELNGLPENYRLPILLCDLEGKTIKEAAQQLGWPQGTLAGRLARGRKLLAKRLANRGVVLSAGSLAAVVSQDVASASLMSSTVKAAAGQAMVPTKVAILTEGVLKAMLLTKLKAAIAVVLVLGFMATGATVLTCRTATAQSDGPPVGSGSPIVTEGKAKDALQGTWTYTGRGWQGNVTEKLLRKYPEEKMGRLTFSDGECAWELETSHVSRLHYTLETRDGSRWIVFQLRNPDPRMPPIPKSALMQKYVIQGDKLTFSSLVHPVAKRPGDPEPAVRPDEPGVVFLHAYFKRDAGTGAKHDTAKTDLDRLQGVWSVVSIEQGGRPAKLEKAVFMVDGKRACWQTSDSEMQGGLYLEPTRKPKTYDFVMSTRTMEGIYSLEGDDTLRLCHDLGTEAKRPVGLTTEKGSQQVLFVLKRTHGPEVFPFRLADGTRGFPTIIEKAKTPPPQTAPTPEDRKNPYNEANQKPKMGSDPALSKKPAVTLPPKADANAQGRNDKEKLQGIWQVVVLETAGLRLEEGSQVIKGFKVRFSGNSMTFIYADRDREDSFDYRVQSSDTPKGIQFSSEKKGKAEVYRGIYQVDEDDLKIHFVKDGEAKLPTNFRPALGRNRWLYTLRREQPSSDGKRRTGLSKKEGVPSAKSEVRFAAPNQQYGGIYDTTLGVLSDHFKIDDANRFEGRIDTCPAFVNFAPDAGGEEEPSVRHRATARITPLAEGGFSVEVIVLRERKVVPPASPFTGAVKWEAAGRDHEFERKLLTNIEKGVAVKSSKSGVLPPKAIAKGGEPEPPLPRPLQPVGPTTVTVQNARIVIAPGERISLKPVKTARGGRVRLEMEGITIEVPRLTIESGGKTTQLEASKAGDSFTSRIFSTREEKEIGPQK
jgi:RNA polymerase sigma factor (sigma-70 family)